MEDGVGYRLTGGELSVFPAIEIMSLYDVLWDLS